MTDPLVTKYFEALDVPPNEHGIHAHPVTGKSALSILYEGCRKFGNAGFCAMLDVEVLARLEAAKGIDS